jgi:hypothetical protein
MVGTPLTVIGDARQYRNGATCWIWPNKVTILRMILFCNEGTK